MTSLLAGLRRWAWNVLIALDQRANALTGGDPDETISSRVGKCVRVGRLRWLGALLDEIFGPRHCENSIEPDEGKDAL